MLPDGGWRSCCRCAPRPACLSPQLLHDLAADHCTTCLLCSPPHVPLHVSASLAHDREAMSSVHPLTTSLLCRLTILLLLSSVLLASTCQAFDSGVLLDPATQPEPAGFRRHRGGLPVPRRLAAGITQPLTPVSPVRAGLHSSCMSVKSPDCLQHAQAAKPQAPALGRQR